MLCTSLSTCVRSAVNTTLCVSFSTRVVLGHSQKNGTEGRKTRARARDQVTFGVEKSSPGTLSKCPATAGRSQLSPAQLSPSSAVSSAPPSPPSPRPGDPLSGPQARGDGPARSPPRRSLPQPRSLGLPRSRHKGGAKSRGDRPLASGRRPHGMGPLRGLRREFGSEAGTRARPRHTNAPALTLPLRLRIPPEKVSLFILGWGKEMRKKRVMYQQLFQVKTKEKDDCQRIYDYDNRDGGQDSWTRPASRSSGPPGTVAHTMADSQRSSAPRCWTACTNFLCTQKGILLSAEIILCLVILTLFSASTSGYSSLSVIELIIASIFFVMYVCDLPSKIQFIHWPWSDFFRSFTATILYLVTSIVVLVERENRSRIVAGTLGLLATCFFGYDAYVTFPFSQ
nr:uncharacterized protein LOC105086276 [Camelus dromedarius]